MMATTTLDFVEDLPTGISCVDTGLVRPGLAACYLMEHQGELAIIETGIRETVARLMALLDHKGLRREQVRYVIITHVHLDHAGGAGLLMQQLPDAKLVVHPRGARHMVDPTKLQAGAVAVYGEENYRRLYGDLLPIPEQRMIIAEDGHVLSLGDRQLQFIDTPGHAKHHFCIYDALSRGIFSGDTLGVVYRELNTGFENFVMPTTTPVQFDPTALRLSIEKLLALTPIPHYIYLTHFGRVDAPRQHADKLLQQIDDYVAIAKNHQTVEKEIRQRAMTEALIDYSLAALAENGSPLTADRQRQLIASDMSLNAMGLDVWLQQMEQ